MSKKDRNSKVPTGAASPVGLGQDGAVVVPTRLGLRGAPLGARRAGRGDAEGAAAKARVTPFKALACCIAIIAIDSLFLNSRSAVLDKACRAASGVCVSIMLLSLLADELCHNVVLLSSRIPGILRVPLLGAAVRRATMRVVRNMAALVNLGHGGRTRTATGVDDRTLAKASRRWGSRHGVAVEALLAGMSEPNGIKVYKRLGDLYEGVTERRLARANRYRASAATPQVGRDGAQEGEDCDRERDSGACWLVLFCGDAAAACSAAASYACDGVPARVQVQSLVLEHSMLGRTVVVSGTADP